MRLLAEFALVLITIACVQSKPVISQVNNLEAVPRTDILALLNELQLNSLEAVLAAFPEHSGLINQLVNVATQVSNALSPAQLYILEQQALQVAQNVFNGNTDINTAVSQLLQKLQEYLGVHSPILANVQPLVQQLVGVVLPLLGSTGSKRSATAPSTDIFALLNELQLNSLEAVLATFPEHSALINELVSIATQVSNALSPAQLFILEQQAIQVAQNVFSGHIDINTAVNQLLQKLQEYLGVNSPILANVQPIVQQLVGTILPLLGSNGSKRSATVASTDIFALLNELQLNSLEAVLATFPEHSALINELVSIATQVSKALSPAQLFILEQQAIQVAQNVFSGHIDINTAIHQLLQKLQEYLGVNSPILANVQPIIQQLVGTILPLLGSNGSKRSANVPSTDILALLNQLQLNSLEAVLAAFPEHSALINQLVSIAIQVSNALSPAQLFILEQQALQVAQNVFDGNTDISTAINQLLQPLQQYLGADSTILANVQPLVQQLVAAVHGLAAQ